MAISIGPRIGIEGDTHFRAVLKEIISSTQVLKSEMDKVTKSFTVNDTALQKHTRTVEELNKVITGQTEVVRTNEMMLRKAEEAEAKSKQRLEEKRQALDEAQTAYDKHQESVRIYTKGLGAAHPFVEKLKEQEKGLATELEQADKEFKKAQTAVANNERFTNLWRVETNKAKIELSELKRQLANAPNYMEEFANKTRLSQEELKRLEQQGRFLDEEIKQTRNGYTLFTGELKKTADTTDYLKRKMENQNDVLRRTETLRKQSEDTVRKEQKALKELEDRLEIVKRSYGSNSEEARLLEEAIHKQRLEVEKATKQTDDFRLKEETLKTAISDTKRELDNQTNALIHVGDKIQSVGNTISGFGDALTKYITTPLIGASTASIKFASDFADGMAKVYTIANESEVPMQEMADGLKALSDESGFSLQDLAEASYQAVSASVATGDALDFVTDATKLARAGFTDVTTAVDILSTIQNVYGKETYSTAEAMDILLKTQNDGKTVVGQLADRMGIIIPMAKNYGVSLEQIAAGYATMTKQGVKTEQATTYFRAMFTELEKEGSDVDKLLDTLTGKTFKQLMDSGYDIADVLKILWRHVNGNSEAFQRLFGNVRSTQAIAALSANNFEILEDELAAMQNTTGLVGEALETLNTPGLKARKTINRLKNASEEFGEDLLNDLLPTLEKVVAFVEKWTTAYREADKPTKDLIKNLVLLVGAVGPVIKVAGVLITGIGGLVKGFGALGALLTTGMIPGVTTLAGAFSVLAPVIGAVGVALGGLLIYDAYAKKQYEDYIQNTYGLTEAEKALCERVNANTEAMRTGREATEENVSAILTNSDGVYKLIERYNELVDEEGNVREGAQGLANVLLTEIAEALGMDIEQVKALRDEHGLLSDAIERTIETKKREAILEAYKEDWIDALKNEAKARVDVAEAQKQLDSAIEEGQQLRQEQAELEAENLRLIQETGEGMEGYNDRMHELGDAIEANAQKQKELGDAVSGAQDELNAASQTVENYEGAMQAVEEGSANAGTAVDMLVEGFKRAGSATGEELRQQYLSTKEHYEKLKKAVEDGAEDITQAELDEAQYRYQQAMNEYVEYNNMLKKEAERGSKEQAQGANKYMSEARRNAAQQKTMTLNGYDDKGEAGRIGSRESKEYANGVDDYRTTAHNNAVAMKNTVESGLEGYQKAYDKGSHMAKGFIDGMLSRYDEIGKAAADLAGHSADKLASKLRERSPSRVTREMGEYFSEGFAIGINSGNRLALTAAENLAGSAVDAMYQPSGWSTAKTVNAPINVNVTVNGNVDDYSGLADVIADRINTKVLQKQGAF